MEYRPGTEHSVGGFDLRGPKCGSIQSLSDNYELALKRYQSPGVTDLEPSAPKYQLISYTLKAAKSCAVFDLRTRSGEFAPYPHARLMHIAGMTRSASIKAMKAFPPEGIPGASEWVKSFVAGHRSEQPIEHQQFSYVPLPSIGHEHADAMIRRIMIVAPFGCEGELRHLAGQIDGEQLQPEGGGEGPILDGGRTGGVIRQYLGPSRTWASVTPVILPGHDDHKPEKTIKLIERALNQSGVDHGCQFEWSSLPNFPNCLSAHKYDRQGKKTGYFRPRYLNDLTAVHMRITFEQAVPGPLVIGSGRHCGFGVFAVLKE